MTMTLTELETSAKLYTVAEFLELDLPETDQEGYPVEYELIRGEIMAKRLGPATEHSRTIGRIYKSLDAFANGMPDQNALGEAFPTCACNLRDDLWVIPDVAFVMADRLPAKSTGPLRVVPDIVVEVNSPSDTLEKIYNKIELYKEVGVRLIWSVYTLHQYVVVYRSNNPKVQFLGFDDVLDGGEVLPGFKLPAAKLFE